MKKSDFLIYGSTLIFSYLFYLQGLGLNLAVFSIWLVLASFISNPEKLKNKNAWFVAILTLIAAGSMTYYGNVLSIIACFFCIVLLFGMTLSTKTGILVGLINGLFTLLMGTYNTIFGKVEERIKTRQVHKDHEENEQKRSYKWGLIAIPIAVVILFFTLYRSANPIFKNLTDKIDLSWISFAWISFTLMGYYLLYGGFQNQSISKLSDFENRENWNIEESNVKQIQWAGKLLAYKDEFFTAKIMFILLNVLILIVNAGDLQFLTVSREIPEGMTFADFLHQGVGVLIFSVIISIALVLFVFRGKLNFESNQKSIKIWAYAWLAQNIIMLISVAGKNAMYISAYGLTYKRIGVYVYVFLTAIGLILTMYKIAKAQSNYGLVRSTSLAFMTVLVISTPFDWDNMIIKCNQDMKKEIDIYYLLSLSDRTIPALWEMKDNIPSLYDRKLFELRLIHKTKLFLAKENNKSWKEWSYANSQAKSKLGNY